MVASAAGLVSLLLFAALGQPALVRQQERAFDWLLGLRPAPADGRVVVIDIDARSQSSGVWTWSRDKTAALIEALEAAGASAIAFDLIFSSACDPLEPSNQALVAATQGAPVVLGFLLSDIAGPAPSPRPPIATRAPLDLPDLWIANGAENSCAFLSDSALGTGTVSLAGDDDGRIRRAPAIVAVGEALYPGLAIETVRGALGVSTPVLSGVPPVLRVGSADIPLDEGGNLRLRPSAPETWRARTVSAEDVLAGTIPLERFRGALVFVGSSLPALGGLRATASSPLQPSVQIHADLASGVLTGTVPVRAASAQAFEVAGALLASLAAALGAVWLRPLPAALWAAALGAIWAASAVLVHVASGVLLDPLFPPLAVLLNFAVASLIQFGAARRAEEALRRRFSQHLPPGIVQRFIENPDLLKLEGEERVVTALISDIEGFSATARLAGPKELIAMLDRYFEGVTRCIIEEGGMVDKIVGDAVHAFFNAPVDLAHHADRALDCALRIDAFAERFRQEPEIARFAFGRTRIGIESGPVVLGDVGASGRIDYTAHGEAVNLASRLEAANKLFGTSILVGPGARALASRALEPLGEQDIRGFGPVALFSPGRTDRRRVQAPTLR